MYLCKAISCTQSVVGNEDYCPPCINKTAANDSATNFQTETGTVLQTSSGGDNDYWLAKILHPKRLEPYDAECEDLIEHFEMSFQEGEAFKALWRKGQLRIGNGKPGDTHIRNAEKVKHFGSRMEAMELRAVECVH